MGILLSAKSIISWWNTRSHSTGSKGLMYGSMNSRFYKGKTTSFNIAQNVIWKAFRRDEELKDLQSSVSLLALNSIFCSFPKPLPSLSHLLSMSDNLSSCAICRSTKSFKNIVWNWPSDSKKMQKNVKNNRSLLSLMRDFWLFTDWVVVPEGPISYREKHSASDRIPILAFTVLISCKDQK